MYYRWYLWGKMTQKKMDLLSQYFSISRFSFIIFFVGYVSIFNIAYVYMFARVPRLNI